LPRDQQGGESREALRAHAARARSPPADRRGQQRQVDRVGAEDQPEDCRAASRAPNAETPLPAYGRAREVRAAGRSHARDRLRSVTYIHGSGRTACPVNPLEKVAFRYREMVLFTYLFEGVIRRS